MGKFETRNITDSEYNKIIKSLVEGIEIDGKKRLQPNKKIAFALYMQGTLGLRIGDTIQMTLDNIIKDGNRYRLDIFEEKTKNHRVFTITKKTYDIFKEYAFENGIRKNEPLVPVSTRAIQKTLKKVVDYLGYTNISTHSFRKYFATKMYVNNNHDIALVQKLLLHSSVNTTRKYIGISEDSIEKAIESHQVPIDPKSIGII